MAVAASLLRFSFVLNFFKSRPENRLKNRQRVAFFPIIRSHSH